MLIVYFFLSPFLFSSDVGYLFFAHTFWLSINLGAHICAGAERFRRCSASAPLTDGEEAEKSPFPCHLRKEIGAELLISALLLLWIVLPFHLVLRVFWLMRNIRAGIELLRSISTNQHYANMYNVTIRLCLSMSRRNTSKLSGCAKKKSLGYFDCWPTDCGIPQRNAIILLEGLTWSYKELSDFH